MARKTPWALSLVASTLITSVASAAVVDGLNWADRVYDHSANIQNYGGVCLSEATEWWLTGPADADVNGNGYIWDSQDQDTVGGWRSTQPDEYIMLQWDMGLPDMSGDDLTVSFYGGSSAGANVYAGVTPDTLQLIGTLASGTPGYITEQALDFGGLFEDDVCYVKLERTASGPQTGMFFDAFAGQVPEPNTLALLALGTLGILRRQHSS